MFEQFKQTFGYQMGKAELVAENARLTAERDRYKAALEHVRQAARDGEMQISKDMRDLEFHMLLKNNVHHHPNLRKTVENVFMQILERCELCLHYKGDHFEIDGTPKWCCDGCDGFQALEGGSKDEIS
jgi:hypothetical protein